MGVVLKKVAKKTQKYDLKISCDQFCLYLELILTYFKVCAAINFVLSPVEGGNLLTF